MGSSYFPGRGLTLLLRWMVERRFNSRWCIKSIVLVVIGFAARTMGFCDRRVRVFMDVGLCDIGIHKRRSPS